MSATAIARNGSAGLVGNRVLLRTHIPADLPRLHEAWADPQAMRYMSVPPMTEPQAANAFDRMLKPDPFARQSYRFAIVRRDDNVLAGTIGIDLEVRS